MSKKRRIHGKIQEKIQKRRAHSQGHFGGGNQEKVWNLWQDDEDLQIPKSQLNRFVSDNLETSVKQVSFDCLEQR